MKIKIIIINNPLDKSAQCMFKYRNPSKIDYEFFLSGSVK